MQGLGPVLVCGILTKSTLGCAQQARQPRRSPRRMFAILTFLGVVLLVHAAWSTMELKQLLSTTTGTAASMRLPPPDVVVEVGVAFLLTLVGLLCSTASFQPIKLSEDVALRSADLYDSRPDFVTFSHRGRALHARRLKLKQ